MVDWTINKSLGQCCGTGSQIEHGQEYFAALVEVGDAFERRDFCAEYWRDEKPDVYCYWKTRRPFPDEKKHIFVDDEMLMAFFERLAEETEQEKINFRFVLGLILMRKRRLKYDSSEVKDGSEIWRLRIVGGERQLVDVVNPNLDEDQIEQLSSQVGQILQVDL